MSNPARGFRLVGLLVAILAGVVAVPSAAAASGEMRVLYALTTWGPMPFTRADAERVAAETDAFFGASSSGRFSMPGSVTGPLRLPRTVFDSCDATALRNAAPPATFAGYDRVVFVTPAVASCQFVGEANPTEVLLNGQLFRARSRCTSWATRSGSATRVAGAASGRAAASSTSTAASSASWAEATATSTRSRRLSSTG